MHHGRAFAERKEMVWFRASSFSHLHVSQSEWKKMGLLTSPLARDLYSCDYWVFVLFLRLLVPSSSISFQSFLLLWLSSFLVFLLPMTFFFSFSSLFFLSSPSLLSPTTPSFTKCLMKCLQEYSPVTPVIGSARSLFTCCGSPLALRTRKDQRQIRRATESASQGSQK